LVAAVLIEADHVIWSVCSATCDRPHAELDSDGIGI
jgi:hypothetical protein